MTFSRTTKLAYSPMHPSRPARPNYLSRWLRLVVPLGLLSTAAVYLPVFHVWELAIFSYLVGFISQRSL
jgi:hypothetical protein